MLRVTTLHASSATTTATYHAAYLTAAPGEVPGLWTGHQAGGLGLSGSVSADALEALLSGRDPVSGTRLGRELVDRFTADGRLIKAVSGFDATFSAPKSLSVWWGLTGDVGLLDAHDGAATAVLDHLERFGSTTRIRRDGGRLHPDTQGPTMATFRQTTSRADDPQIHTHAVISAKVQTSDGRWLALDARYLKRHQRMLGGLYQSALRSELTARFGVAWSEIINGQAEIVGIPSELRALFSKRSSQVEAALDDKVVAFRQREGRDPSRWERAALCREAAGDTRAHKSGHGAADLRQRWQAEAAALGWSAPDLMEELERCRQVREAPREPMTVEDVVDRLSTSGSTWSRADVIKEICDAQRPIDEMRADRWVPAVERAAAFVTERCVDLDPESSGPRRTSDGRSVWLEPTSPSFTSDVILAQEEHVIAWALAAHIDEPQPSPTIDDLDLDVMQAEAAAAVAGSDRLVVVVGPAGAGKTRMLERAAGDLAMRGRPLFGLAPTHGHPEC